MNGNSQMAIFETVPTNESYLDDSIPLFCTFLNSRIVDGHTEYVIEVQRGFNKKNCWKIFKRYREFDELHRELQASYFGINLPQKKYFGNLDRQFIMDRRNRLLNYMSKVLENLVLSSSFYVKKFLDPNNYSISFQESAFQNASMAVRGKPDFHNIKTLPNIGWRLKKHYCSVKKFNEAKKEYILTWISEYGINRCLNDKELQSAFKVFLQLSHPYIVPIVNGSCYSTGALIIRSSCKKGSLRDLICEKSPFDKFLNKCRTRNERLILPLSEVITISVQILHALKFLHKKGIPYGNLHSGNIFIEDNVAKISDIESGIFGLPSFYKPYLIENRRIHSIEDVDVYCFGHVLYEMAFGERLEYPYCDVVPSECYENIRPVLEFILSNSPKLELPSVSKILSLDVFRLCSPNVVYEFTPHCKLNSISVNLLQKSKTNIEKNIHHEQNELRKYRKMIQLQELMETEEKFESLPNNKGNRKMKKIRSQSSLETPYSDHLENISTASSTPTSTSTDSSVRNSGCDKSNHVHSDSNTGNSPSTSPSVSESNNRLVFLDSIVNFNKHNLKKPERKN